MPRLRLSLAARPDMNTFSFDWRHVIAAIAVAVAAFLTGQNGGIASILQTVGNSVASVVGTSDTSTDR